MSRGSLHAPSPSRPPSSAPARPPKRQLVPGSVRPRADEAKEEVYNPVAAPKRKRVEEEPEITEIPKASPLGAHADDVTARRAHASAVRASMRMHGGTRRIHA